MQKDVPSKVAAAPDGVLSGPGASCGVGPEHRRGCRGSGFWPWGTSRAA